MRLLAAAVLVLASANALAQQVEPGEWEFVTEIAIPGLPRPQQAGVRMCLTREQARDPINWTAHGSQPADCRITSLKLGPDTASWAMECPESGMRGAGKARIAQGSLEAELQIGGGNSVDMRTKTQGRRLGPCTQ
jgi:hypothetical protein